MPVNEWLNAKLAERVEELESSVENVLKILEHTRTNADPAKCRLCRPGESCAMHARIEELEALIDASVESDDTFGRLKRLEKEHSELQESHQLLKEAHDLVPTIIEDAVARAQPELQEMKDRIETHRSFTHRVAERLKVPRQHPHERMLAMIEDAIRKLIR